MKNRIIIYDDGSFRLQVERGIPEKEFEDFVSQLYDNNIEYESLWMFGTMYCVSLLLRIV